MTSAHAPAIKPAAAPAAPELKRVGRFTIIRELGRGAIGVVYLAHDPIIDRQVALKTFNPKLTQVERKRHEEQLINEARAAGRLSHPHIITIFDANTEGGLTYIAMEYLQGRELSRLLAHAHPFELNDIATIVWKVADALDYAHRNGVVHRDIKPANIFMVGENQPKIVDFGIARSPNRVADQYAGTNDAPYTLFHNNILGTPTYMSPEQACGEPADARSDIYALGAVMYELLTGRKPFQSRDTEKLLQMIALKTPPAPHEVDAEVPEMLSAIVMKAMQKRPEKRYQTAHEMASDIKRYLVKGRRPQAASAGSSAEGNSAAPARRGKLLWLAGLLVLAGAAALLGPRLLP